jgi:hypothetical protein
VLSSDSEAETSRPAQRHQVGHSYLHQVRGQGLGPWMCSPWVCRSLAKTSAQLVTHTASGWLLRRGLCLADCTAGRGAAGGAGLPAAHPAALAAGPAAAGGARIDYKSSMHDPLAAPRTRNALDAPRGCLTLKRHFPYDILCAYLASAQAIGLSTSRSSFCAAAAHSAFSATAGDDGAGLQPCEHARRASSGECRAASAAATPAAEHLAAAAAAAGAPQWPPGCRGDAAPQQRDQPADAGTDCTHDKCASACACHARPVAVMPLLV